MHIGCPSTRLWSGQVEDQDPEALHSTPREVRLDTATEIIPTILTVQLMMVFPCFAIKPISTQKKMLLPGARACNRHNPTSHPLSTSYCREGWDEMKRKTCQSCRKEVYGAHREWWWMPSAASSAVSAPSLSPWTTREAPGLSSTSLPHAHSPDLPHLSLLQEWLEIGCSSRTCCKALSLHEIALQSVQCLNLYSFPEHHVQANSRRGCG